MTPPKKASPTWPPANPPTVVLQQITSYRDQMWVVDWCTSWTPHGLHGIIHREPACMTLPCTTHGGPQHAENHVLIPRNNSEHNPALGTYFTVRRPGAICWDCRVKDRTRNYVLMYKGQLNDSRGTDMPPELVGLSAEFGSAAWWREAEEKAKERAERVLREQNRGPDIFGR